MTTNIKGKKPTLKVSLNSYANAMAVNPGKEALKEKGIESFEGKPADNNRCFEEGLVQMGMLSAGQFAEISEGYFILPFGVSAPREVNSLYVISKKPLEELKDGDRMTMTNTSKSSVLLFKIIAKKFLNVSLNYSTMDPDLEEMMKDNEAALIIGDEAIQANWVRGINKNEFFVYDLADLWHKYTGKSITLMVIAVQKNALHEYADEIKTFYDECLQTKLFHQRDNFDQLSRECQSKFGASYMFWRMYFRTLKYDIEEAEIEGLKLYFKLLFECGLISRPVNFEMIDFATKTKRLA